MPKTWSEGEAVQIADRETGSADTKSGLFYPHYRNLQGTIGKVYADGTAAVDVDAASLPADIRARHESGTGAMRQKWLDGLSDEARNKLSAAEKKFSLRYTVLVSQADLSPAQTKQAALDLDVTPEPSRKSLDEIEAEEARHLDEVRKKRA